MSEIPYGELPEPTEWDWRVISAFRLSFAEADRLLAARAICWKRTMGYSLRQACASLGIHPSTGYRWVTRAEWMDDYLREIDASAQEPAPDPHNDIPF
jgi:hypothetical protein